MQDFQALMNQYLKGELLVLIPVLYVIARIIHNSQIRDDRLPFIVLVIAVVLSAIYTFATSQIDTLQHILLALFSSIVQGILLTGTSIYGGIVIKILNQKNTDK